MKLYPLLVVCFSLLACGGDDNEKPVTGSNPTPVPSSSSSPSSSPLPVASPSPSMTPQPVGSDLELISEVTFTDANLSHCINRVAQANNWTRINQVDLLTCRHQGITNLSGLEHFSALRELNFNNNSLSHVTFTRNDIDPNSKPNAIEDLSPLQSLQSLTFLALSQNRIHSLEALQSLTNLESLDISYNYIDSLSPLANLTKMRYLYAGKNEIMSFSEIGEMAELERLELTANSLSSLVAVPSLPSLEVLRLSHNTISNLEFSDTLPELRHLEIGENKIENVDFLVSTPSLEQLYASNNSISDVGGLAYVESLVTASLNNNDIEQLRVFSTLTSLRSLYLSNNNIENVALLSGAESLETLYLDNNRIKRLIGIGELENLTDLSLDSNAIGEDSTLELALAPLGQLSQLNSLSIDYLSGEAGDNPLGFLENLTQLKELKLNENRVPISIAPIVSLTELNSLELSGWSQPIDLSHLSHLDKLISLNLYYTPALNDDYDPLLRLADTLEFLSINLVVGSQLQDVLPRLEKVVSLGLAYRLQTDMANTELDVLSQMPQLRSLDISSANFLIDDFPKADISPLSDLTNLTELNLGFIGVESLEPIGSLAMLERFHLNNVESDQQLDYTMLNDLERIYHLELQNMKLTNIDFLDTFKHRLQFLALTRNDLTDFSILNGADQLAALDISFNRLDDISAADGMPNLFYLNIRGASTLVLENLDEVKANRGYLDISHSL